MSLRFSDSLYSKLNINLSGLKGYSCISRKVLQLLGVYVMATNGVGWVGVGWGVGGIGCGWDGRGWECEVGQCWQCPTTYISLCV